MFVSASLVLDLSAATAQSRLTEIVRDTALTQASQEAYLSGMDQLLRVGPLGDRAGASRLVHVQLLDPVCRDDVMTVGVRWEAVGRTASLFPVLDADIKLSASPGGRESRLEIIGCYRPPFGIVGAGLDRVLMHSVAELTLRSVLTSLAASLTETAPTAEPASAVSPGQAAWPEQIGPHPVCG